MEEKMNLASRWLMALAVLMIPLSVIAIVSGAWGVNYQFDTNQWTNYLVFVSWVLFLLSIVAGIVNVISPPELEGEKAETAAPVAEVSGPDADEEEEVGTTVPAKKKKSAFNFAYAMLLTQVFTFSLGMVVYVAYISWMILGLKAYPTTSF